MQQLCAKVFITGATDSATPANALTYDLKIGTSPGAADVYHPMADIATGYRRVASKGRPSFAAHRLPPGQVYYASAQAIDGGFMGSAWGPQITIDLSVANQDDLQAPPMASIYPNPFSDVLNIKIASNTAKKLSAEIYNLKGQRIIRLPAGDVLDGNKAMQWDGTDQHGKHVGNGVYYLRLTDGAKVSLHKLLFIR